MNIPYEPSKIEPKWQDFWKTNETFKAEPPSEKEPFYCLDMFPYPSGAGLHVGHPLGYTATDIICRKRRMEGKNVLHPMGWDAFGLPAENYAIKTGTHPSVSTQHNINTFRGQIERLGFSYDWSREIDTTDPKYVKWTQWIFLQLYNAGLVYEKEMPMYWCPECRVVVANEEVEGGCHERCGNEVERRPMRQWMMKITAYAQRLLDDLDTLDGWPEGIKEMQRNWIGRSEGLQMRFQVADHDEFVELYTTRPDTIFGATYVVLAPEHRLVDELTTPAHWDEVDAYRTAVANKSDLQRTEMAKDKTGVFTGAYAINPMTHEKLPIWVGDYVLMSYGTGAIMCVPAHDERDNEFAHKYNLPVKNVVKPPKNWAGDLYTEKGGTCVNSGVLDGMAFGRAFGTVCKIAERDKWGERKVQFRLRDWVFSRNRYWGEPIPLVHGNDGKVRVIDESELPLLLPETDDYKPLESGGSPLDKCTDWVNTLDGKRETLTMPNWAGSSWYYLRFMDAQNDEAAWAKDVEEYWGGVDLYVGGAEHAVLHLLYARFWHKALFDLGLVSGPEPFKSLKNQGLILAEDGSKMSKSLGNTVNPDDIIAEFGADTLRTYEMFMGQFDQPKMWSTGSVGGVRKFLERVWRVAHKPVTHDAPDEKTLRIVHQSIKNVSERIERFAFNTAVSQLMVLTNELTSLEIVPEAAVEVLVQLVSPFAPHMAEEIWSTVLKKPDTIAYSDWPQWDEKLAAEDEITYAVQVNGKVRETFSVPAETTKSEIIAHAKDLPKVAKYLSAGEIKKEIFVPNKIIGFVVA